MIVFKIIIFLNIASILSAYSYRTQFNNVCGQKKKTGRIVGGTDVDLGEFPWHARIGVKEYYFENPRFDCGGSLFTDRHVLTAKHCFIGRDRRSIVENTVVSLGDHFSKYRDDCVGSKCSNPPVTYTIVEIFARDLDGSINIDIAILRLSNKVEFTNWILPVCLPDNISPTIGDKVTVMGFGLVDSLSKKLATVLQKITISIKPFSSCYMFDVVPGPGQICAGSVDKDSCAGDSGGPLVKLINGENGPRYVQLGIVSYGAEHCEDKHPAVYTDVNYYLQWIDDHLGP